ncbi:MAG TPA: succinate dehydrogenase cytochrome b558 subunit [Thermoanaerobaculia bacterium]|nr:succinate dehydrogenase cytochrome b558 subunit [Thermoanaerobaculia bacterium]
MSGKVTGEERHFWLRRLHSLSGIVPIGGYLAFHLYENYQATRGAEAYNAMVRQLQQMPLALALEIGVIALPLFFHGVYGLFVTGTARPNVISSRYVRNWMYFFQRVTGVILFAFVIFHLWTTRLVNVRDHESVDLFRLMQSSVENPWIYAFYVAGILSATFHLANGIWSFSIVWGLTVGPRAQRRMMWVSAVVFVVLSILGIGSIQAFRA